MGIKEGTSAREELLREIRRRIDRARIHTDNTISIRDRSPIRDPPNAFQNYVVPIRRNLNPIFERSGRGSMRPTIYRSGQSAETVQASRPFFFSIPPSRMMNLVANPFASHGASPPARYATHPAGPPARYATHPAGPPARYATHPAGPPTHYAIYPTGPPAHYATHPAGPPTHYAIYTTGPLAHYATRQTVRRNFEVPDAVRNAVLQARLSHYPISTNQPSGSNEDTTVRGSQPDGRPNISNRFATITAAGSSNTGNFPPSSPIIPGIQYGPQRLENHTISEACSLMANFDVNLLSGLIEETLCAYSLRIYGLEDCPMRDLMLAVFFFIERYFDFHPSIELCVRHIPDPADPNVVGVILERTTMRNQILQESYVLEGTNYRIRENTDPSWIVSNYGTELN